MKSEFEQGKSEFKKENYKKALAHFELIKSDDDYYDVSLLYRITSLMHLKRYRESLSFLNQLIEEYPQEYLLWFDKARCHIFLKETDNAYVAVEHVERFIDSNDKNHLIYVSKLYNMLHDDSKAIEYADKALAIDENFEDALYEKYFVALRSCDDAMIEEISLKLYDMSDKSLMSSMPRFLLKLYFKEYVGALDLINDVVDDEVDYKYIKILKAAIYEHMSEDLSAQIVLSQKLELDIDDALEIMFDFKENGKDHGEIHGVNYFII